MFSLSLSILEDKMEKEYNKEEYNKLCAEFMGYKLVTPEMRKHPEEWISSYWENPDFNGSSKGVLCSENGLQYNTNWNWIMEIKNKILSINQFSLTGQRFKFNIYGCAKHRRDEEDTPYKIRVEGVLSSEKFPSIEINGFDEKEAVVKAIWEFLNWYKDNK